ncbi:hypothetical protein [Rhizobium sp. WYCCWR 11146]|uniref:hypothetical protein n=1 Tax=Rhizobium sp. WYCCWR 11146 TaxID=2749833 RepID=UPI0015E63233|nr:hypothetical protein [Rhizobium sp. WYCCWR 11146]MBA1343901.1 hypothetical protein [Rhizobium sp. WYCCWR 11146]
MTMLSITTTNIEAIEGIIDGAKATGQIDYDGLKSAAETVHRHDWMRTAAAYLATKNITLAEQDRLDACMASMERADERMLSPLVNSYRRGDIMQMIDALDDVPLSKVERKVVKGMAKDFSGGSLPVDQDRMRRLEAMIERHDVQIELGSLKLGGFI